MKITVAGIRSFAKKQVTSLQKRHDKLEQDAVKQAQNRMARARTDHERKMVREKLAQERAKLRRELSEAKTATNKARDAAEKARKESGDLNVSERLWKFGGEMRKTVGDLQKWGEGKPRRKRVVKRAIGKTAKRRVTRRR
jgi:septal ring factor EnvC (AmiA/AmiB activator)